MSYGVVMMMMMITTTIIIIITITMRASLTYFPAQK